MTDIATQLEALLFFRGAPVSFKELAKDLGVDSARVREGLETLRGRLEGRGVTLSVYDDAALLTTTGEMSETIERLTKEELERDLGKAGLETLTVILYHGPVSRAQIDYIRGVNSTFTLRQLMVRGLIERIDNPKDGRGFLYKPTFELLSFLGLSSLEELPEYEAVRGEMRAFEEGAATMTDTNNATNDIPTIDA